MKTADSHFFGRDSLHIGPVPDHPLGDQAEGEQLRAGPVRLEEMRVVYERDVQIKAGGAGIKDSTLLNSLQRVGIDPIAVERVASILVGTFLLVVEREPDRTIGKSVKHPLTKSSCQFRSRAEAGHRIGGSIKQGISAVPETSGGYHPIIGADLG